MTNETAAITTADQTLVAEFAGGASSSVSAMIGIGAVKDSDAPFQQYVGEEQEPVALMHRNGKPVTAINNVQLVGIDVADGIGKFNSTKLNIYLKSSQGNVALFTCGLTTYAAQYAVTGLLGMVQEFGIESVFHMRASRGDQGMRPWFTWIVPTIGGKSAKDETVREQLKASKGTPKLEALMRDSVEALKLSLGVTSIQEIEVTEATSEEVPF